MINFTENKPKSKKEVQKHFNITEDANSYAKDLQKHWNCSFPSLVEHLIETAYNQVINEKSNTLPKQ